jgi:hypoxanthine-guanine phosphoribosyltransferase
MEKLKRFGNKLWAQAEENPLMALTIATGAIMAVSKLIESMGYATRAQVYARKS